MAKRKTARRGPAPGDYSRSIRRSDYPSAGGSFFDPNPWLPRAYEADRRPLEPLERPPTLSTPYRSLNRVTYPRLIHGTRPPRVFLPPVTYGRKAAALPLHQQFRSLKALTSPEAYRAKHCLDRKQRREVLFAFNHAGKSGQQRGKRYRRTPSSNYSC